MLVGWKGKHIRFIMPGAMRVIFVQRGKYATYDVLVERCQLIRDVDVRWDRRLGDDRRTEEHPVGAERRRRDRRRQMPPDVTLRGYTVADLPSP
jgi:hypothetical protein